MAKLQTYVCDECGAIRRETNGWWLIQPGTLGLTIWPWSNLQNEQNTWEHMCGIECCQKRVARWMARGEH